jgi:hypothetical protein
MRVLENCNIIVASSLKQTTWLRKNLHVRFVQSEAETIPINIDSSNETGDEGEGDNTADSDG